MVKDEMLQSLKEIKQSLDDLRRSLSKKSKNIREEGVSILKRFIDPKFYEKYKEKRKENKRKEEKKCKKKAVITLINFLIGFSIICTCMSTSVSFNNEKPFIMYLLFIIGVIFLGSSTLYLLDLSISKDFEKNTPLKTDQEIMIESFKNKNLTLEEIRALKDVISEIKLKMTINEFDDVLLMIQEKTGKEIGNAYFYYVLFDDYDVFLNEVKRKNETKKLLGKITRKV